MCSPKLALAAAGALITLGCAPAPWQRPAGHPADPGQAPGVVQPTSALEQYRAGKPLSKPAEEPHSHSDKEGKP
jgi:hypothetical protein